MTVSVAAVDVAVLQTFVKTARYCLALSALVAVKLSVVEVAPSRLLNVTPLSMETCHCTVGAGLPEAAAVKVAVVLLHTVCDAGLVVTAAAVFTVSVAELLFTVLQEFVNAARYCFPLSAAAVAKVYVVLVAPRTLVNVTPPSLDTCH